MREEYIRRADAMGKITSSETQEALQAMTGEEAYVAVVGILNELPAADVAPVVHGRWDNSGRYTFPSGSTAVRCINCGCALTESEYRLNNWNYCPVCGAKMDGAT